MAENGWWSGMEAMIYGMQTGRAYENLGIEPAKPLQVGLGRQFEKHSDVATG
jgi:hypothetical protein